MKCSIRVGKIKSKETIKNRRKFKIPSSGYDIIFSQNIIGRPAYDCGLKCK